MDVPATPSIRISHYARRISPSQRSPLQQSSSPSSTGPMSIPSRAHAYPPPPPALPPPRNVEELGIIQEPGWPFTNTNWQGFGSVKSESTLPTEDSANPGQDADGRRPELDMSRRGSSITTITPSGNARASLDSSQTPVEDEMRSSKRSPDYRLEGVRQLEQRALDETSRSYDRDLLSKIGGPNTPQRLSISSYTSPTEAANGGVSPGRTDSRAPSFSRPSAFDRRRSSNDTRWGSVGGMPTSASANACASANPNSPGPFRSPLFDQPEITRLAQRHPSLTFDESASHRGSHDSGMFSLSEDVPAEDGHPSQSPGGQDEYQRGAHAGMKRRASSPPREATREERSSVGSAAGAPDLYHRRSLAGLRYRQLHYGSVSSVSSAGYRTGSLGSSLGLSIASSATSLASGRISPSNLSPAIDPELTGPFFSKSLNPSPRGSLSTTSAPRIFSELSEDQMQRSPDEISPQHMAGIQGRISPMSGKIVCECCPKKPRKFDKEEDLRLHHMEKQYTCLYCPNRFKNKNEAERHQNSLHLRRQSWACSAIPSAKDAFHPSPANAGVTDQCGFCGEDFSNPPQADRREEHLTGIHKFRECNLTKKFFRADHFRQHLKHSHSGTSGKWTNMLETACMREEPPPQPLNPPPRGNAITALLPADQVSMPPPPPNIIRTAPNGEGEKPGVIDEVPNEA